MNWMNTEKASYYEEEDNFYEGVGAAHSSFIQAFAKIFAFRTHLDSPCESKWAIYAQSWEEVENKCSKIVSRTCWMSFTDHAGDLIEIWAVMLESGKIRNLAHEITYLYGKLDAEYFYELS